MAPKMQHNRPFTLIALYPTEFLHKYT